MAYKAFQTLLSSIAGETHLKYLEKKNINEKFFSNIKPSRTSKLNIFAFSAFLLMSKAGSMSETKWRGLFSSREKWKSKLRSEPDNHYCLRIEKPVCISTSSFLWIPCTKPLMTIYVIDKLHPTHFDYSFPFLFWNECPSTFTWVN